MLFVKLKYLREVKMSFFERMGFNFIFSSGKLVGAERTKYINEKGVFRFGYIVSIERSNGEIDKYYYYADESINYKIGSVIYFDFLSNGNGCLGDLLHIYDIK